MDGRASHRGSGALIERFFTLGFALMLGAYAVAALGNLAGGSTIDLDALIPRLVVPHAHEAGLQIEGTPDQQVAIRQALDGINWPIDTSGLTIVVTSPKNLPPDTTGTYLYPENVISLSSDVVNDPSQQLLAQVLAHEVGHLFDCKYLDQAAHDEYLALRGFPVGTDWGSDDSDWVLRPSEDFAEVFAAFAMPSSRMPIATDLGRMDNPEQVGALIARYQQSAE